MTTDRPLLRTTLPLLAILLLPMLVVGCGPWPGDDDAKADRSESNADQEYADKMATEHAEDTTDGSPAIAGDPDLVGEDVVYANVGGTDVTGYLVRPAEPVPGMPAVIVIQEWWGLNDNIRVMARKLAAEGYLALAVDLYGGQVADTPERARELVTAAMAAQDSLDQNLQAAYTYLESQGATRIGSIGWCFGGGMSLRTALLHPKDLDAAVIYYGRVVTDEAQLTDLDVPILGLFGAEDQGIPVDDVRAFEAALATLGKTAEIHVYEGADHAFANPTGQRYQAEAAEDAWAKTLAFFASHLRAGET